MRPSRETGILSGLRRWEEVFPGEQRRACFLFRPPFQRECHPCQPKADCYKPKADCYKPKADCYKPKADCYKPKADRHKPAAPPRAGPLLCLLLS